MPSAPATASLRIGVPKDHPTGTYWYHPHHGTVADQIYAGLVGAVLVRGPDLPVAEDRVLLVTDTTLDTAGPGRPARRRQDDGPRRGLVLVNGQHQPDLAASTGTTERWRVINIHRGSSIWLDGHRVTQIADGAVLRALDRDRSSWRPATGRLLVRPTAAGRYELVSSPITAAAR
jgi:FtsP/CotA-like multicopper oxidase with cupredoxin domain